MNELKLKFFLKILKTNIRILSKDTNLNFNPVYNQIVTAYNKSKDKAERKLILTMFVKILLKNISDIMVLKYLNKNLYNLMFKNFEKTTMIANITNEIIFGNNFFIMAMNKDQNEPKN